MATSLASSRYAVKDAGGAGTGNGYIDADFDLSFNDINPGDSTTPPSGPGLSGQLAGHSSTDKYGLLPPSKGAADLKLGRVMAAMKESAVHLTSGASSMRDVPSQQSTSTVAAQGPSHQAENAPATPNAPIIFEGDGLMEVGTTRCDMDGYDDEFDYAFDGGARQGEAHKQVFKPKVLPTHLVTNVKEQLLNAVEEGEEEEEEEEEDEEGDHPLGDFEDATTSQKFGQTKVLPSGWSTFVASDANMFPISREEPDMTSPRGLIQVQDLAPPPPPPPPLPSNQPPSRPMSASQQDLPSFKLLKALSSEEHKIPPPSQQPNALSSAFQAGAASSPTRNYLMAGDSQAGSAGASQQQHPLLQGGSLPNANINLAFSTSRDGLNASRGAEERSGKHSKASFLDELLAQHPEEALQQQQQLADAQHRSGNLLSGSPGSTTTSIHASILDSSVVKAVAAASAVLNSNPGSMSGLTRPQSGSAPGAVAAALAAGSLPPSLNGSSMARSLLAAAVASRPGSNSISGAAGGHPGAASSVQHAVSTPGGSVRMQTEADEWDLANQQRMLEMAALETQARSGPDVSQFVASYHEVLLHLMSCDVEGVRPGVEQLLPKQRQGGLLQRLLCLAPPELSPLLKQQQVRLLCLARVPFSDADPMHMKLLCSLYGSFTGKSPVQPRYGPHWMAVGFQGDDPATDLRGCGIYGLLQLYYLHHHDPANAGRIFELSTSRTQEFPMSTVSLNVTKWALQAMRCGSLDRDALRCGSMVEAANKFYVGAMYAFYDAWVDGRKTMADSGFVLKDLEASCSMRVSAIIAASGRTLKDCPAA